MKLSLKITKEFDVKYLFAEVGVRYWADGTINGVKDVDGTLTPHRIGDYWNILIDVETGKIVDWPTGTEASVYYECYDDGVFKLLDVEKNVISTVEGYVPRIMCPEEFFNPGEGVAMIIASDGQIQNWRISESLSLLEDFV